MIFFQLNIKLSQKLKWKSWHSSGIERVQRGIMWFVITYGNILKAKLTDGCDNMYSNF